jgi:hypothetical protein
VFNLEIPNLKNWKTAFLLSMIVPVSLLVTFKLTGIIKDSASIAETTVLPSKGWSFQRPYPDKDVEIYRALNATYMDPTVSFSIKMWIFKYDPIWDIRPYVYVRFGFFFNISTSPEARLQSIVVVFLNDSHASTVDLIGTSIKPANLTITSLKQSGGPQDFEKVHIELAPTNDSDRVGFKAIGEWSFPDVSLDAKDHQLEILCALIYCDGTAFKKLVQPFQLKILKSG